MADAGVVTPTKISVAYGMASYSAQRKEGPDAIALRVAVLDLKIYLTVPMPKWFRKHTYNVTIKVPSGNVVKSKPDTEVITRTVRDYLDYVVMDKVRQLLEDRNYAPFTLSICGQG
jgi:hypothetical protein